MSIEQLFEGDITDEIKQLVRERLVDGGNLATRKDLTRKTVKLALLLLRETNSIEHLSREEKAILMGVNKETVTKMDQDKTFIHVVNH